MFRYFRSDVNDVQWLGSANWIGEVDAKLRSFYLAVPRAEQECAIHFGMMEGKIQLELDFFNIR